MKIRVNGVVEECSEGQTLSDYMKVKGFDPALVSLEHNGRILDKDDWSGITLRDDDEVEVLFFMGGGV